MSDVWVVLVDQLGNGGFLHYVDVDSVHLSEADAVTHIVRDLGGAFPWSSSSSEGLKRTIDPWEAEKHWSEGFNSWYGRYYGRTDYAPGWWCKHDYDIDDPIGLTIQQVGVTWNA